MTVDDAVATLSLTVGVLVLGNTVRLFLRDQRRAVTRASDSRGIVRDRIDARQALRARTLAEREARETLRKKAR